MTEEREVAAYGWDTDPEVLTLAADLAEMSADLNAYAAEIRDLREQVAAGLARETFLHQSIAQLRTELRRAAEPAAAKVTPLTLAA